MRRREFITVLGGAGAWPAVARGQPRDRVRRIGVLTPWASDDAEAQDRVTAFTQGLQQLGWAVGQNVRVDYRWGDGKVATTRKYASELVALAPDVILALRAPPSRRCWRSPAAFRLCLRVSPIQLPLAMSKAWRGQAAT